MMGDYVAEHWFSEILQQTEMTQAELLYKIQHIQMFGHGKYLTGTNSYRIPLARIAEDYGVELTDGSEIQSSASKGDRMKCPKCSYSALLTYDQGKEEHPAVVRTTDDKWLCVICRHEWPVQSLLEG